MQFLAKNGEAPSRCVAICCRGLTTAAKGIPAARENEEFIHRQGIPLSQRGQYRLLRATIQGLRVHAPAAYPVIVRSGWNIPDNADAYCTRRTNRFVIMLGQHLQPKSAVEACLHEWAHARAWNHRHDRAVEDVLTGAIDDREFETFCHDSAWGVEYAHCWRVYTGVVLPLFETQLSKMHQYR